jgi:hypothetical protein
MAVDSGLRTLTFLIEGTSAIITHNGQLSNQFAPITKRLKALTSKRKKTEQDAQEIAEVEWEGGLYLNKNNEVFLPSLVLNATFWQGAKKSKQGVQWKSGVFMNEDGEFTHNGPRTKDELYKRFSEFSDIRMVVVNGNRVARCRPIFNDWKCKFTLEYDPTIIEEADVIAAVTNAGRLVGLCEMRPQYGRFTVKSVS